MNALPAVTFPANFTLAPILALVAGIPILVRPKLLNFIVAIYLIAFGLITSFNPGETAAPARHQLVSGGP